VRDEIAGQPTLVALPFPRPYSDYGRFAKYRVNESFPPAVAAFIYWLLHDSGWTVEENGGATPIARAMSHPVRRFRNLATTSRAGMCGNSRYAASRMCSSAGGRFTNAKR